MSYPGDAQSGTRLGGVNCSVGMKRTQRPPWRACLSPQQEPRRYLEHERESTNLGGYGINISAANPPRRLKQHAHSMIRACGGFRAMHAVHTTMNPASTSA